MFTCQVFVSKALYVERKFSAGILVADAKRGKKMEYALCAGTFSRTKSRLVGILRLIG